MAIDEQSPENPDDYNERLRNMEEEKKAAEEKPLDEKDIASSEDRSVTDGYDDDLLLKKQDGEESERPKDIKSIKKAKKEREKQIQLAVKENKKKREELAGGKYGIVAFAKKVMDKLAAFKMHSVRASGDQAGVFDNQKGVDGKRRVEHDFDFGAETVVEKFTTTVNGVKVSGTVTRKFDDGPGGEIQQVGDQKISISKASVDGHSVSPEKLGNISHDAIMNAVDRSGGYER